MFKAISAATSPLEQSTVVYEEATIVTSPPDSEIRP
jgi:hypothetical protein